MHDLPNSFCTINALYFQLLTLLKSLEILERANKVDGKLERLGISHLIFFSRPFSKDKNLQPSYIV